MTDRATRNPSDRPTTDLSAYHSTAEAIAALATPSIGSPSQPRINAGVTTRPTTVETVNATLPPAQRISRFLLLYKELDADDGELTRTRKVRRGVINEKYADIIEAIYRGKANIPVDTVIRFQDGTTQRVRTTLQVVDLGRAAIAEAAE